MTPIAVMPTFESPTSHGYRAITNGTEATGKTPGAALDALVAQTGRPQDTTLIILHAANGDEFFTSAQRTRLEELMRLWREARDFEKPFPSEMQSELDGLIQDELRGATNRAAALLRVAKS